MQADNAVDSFPVFVRNNGCGEDDRLEDCSDKANNSARFIRVFHNDICVILSFRMCRMSGGCLRFELFPLFSVFDCHVTDVRCAGMGWIRFQVVNFWYVEGESLQIPHECSHVIKIIIV